MERLTPEALEEAIISSMAFARTGLAADSPLWRRAAARLLSFSIFEHLESRSLTDDRQLTLPLAGTQLIADEA